MAEEIPIVIYESVVGLIVKHEKRDTGNDKLTLFEAHYDSETVTTPARSFMVWGRDGILKLRDALNSAYPEGKEDSNG